MAMTLVQLNAPEHIRGRVIGLNTMSALGLCAFSGVIGIHWSLALSAMILLGVIVMLSAFALPSTRTATEHKDRIA